MGAIRENWRFTLLLCVMSAGFLIFGIQLGGGITAEELQAAQIESCVSSRTPAYKYFASERTRIDNLNYNDFSTTLSRAEFSRQKIRRTNRLNNYLNALNPADCADELGK